MDSPVTYIIEPGFSIKPFTGLYKPASISNKVVLPEPFSPRKPIISRKRRFRFTPFSNEFCLGFRGFLHGAFH